MSIRDGLDKKCPFLGLEDDPDTSLDYPSAWNYCYHSQPIAAVSPEHQGNCCLSTEHKNCPIFLRTEGAPLPLELCARLYRFPQPEKPYWRIALFILIGIVVVGLTGLFTIFRGASFHSQSNEMHTPEVTTTYTASPTPTITYTPTHTATPTLTPTNTPTHVPTSTPAPTSPSSTPSIRALDTLIGSEHKFIIHKALAGESFQLYASKHRTTVEAIQAVNYNLLSPLWEGWIIVIPVGFSNMQGLPAFEPYMVAEKDLSVAEIAQKLSADPAMIMKYNNLGDDYRSIPGDWLLIPRTISTPSS